ncbi:hypothetical protein F511_22484 [Dorcoceras hygrometricum]|uniref:Uncharacterized protein n=1 Tax=Dorcoceras hygrometricum TaxID=472368 RepID=A0A2Z7BPI2_9LAMI|nr:hypothetical protein F511_22484 [Dorcoceras hygrometricum]
MAPFVPCTRDAADIHLKQIALNNQSCMIRRLRAKLATERRKSASIKEELENKVFACQKKTERMKTKRQQARESHLECHHKLQVRIQEAEDTIQEQHIIIEALVEDKASLLQTIQDLLEENDSPAPFDDEWEEDLEEEGLEDIPVGEGEIVDE